MPDPISSTFDYELPKRLIAQHPLKNRGDARLMVVDRSTQQIEHAHIRDLPDILRRGDRLVLNNTQVVPAQLVGQREETSGRWQGLFLEELPGRDWKIVCKTRGRLKAGDCVRLFDRDMRLREKLWLLERLDGGQWLAHPDSDRPAMEVLAEFGRVPLPHYIRGGSMVDADVAEYQTVFASKPGAVAAPTAGLHFTEPLLQTLRGFGINLSAVTLHVGLGTFRPISTDDIKDHEMHQEWCEVNSAAANEIAATRQDGGRIIAVGTTVVRTLESAALNQPEGNLEAWSGDTRLFIRPPFEFRAVDVLLTNFHFPKTTLLVLVQTFGGTELIREAYAEAVRQEYRFYSYGDAMLIQ